MLEKIDDKLLSFFDNICHFIQKFTGIDNFNVAKIFIIVVTFLFIVNDTVLFLYIWSILVCLYLLGFINYKQNQYYSRLQNETLDPARYDSNKKNVRSVSIIIDFLCLIYVIFINHYIINEYLAFKVFATLFSMSVVNYLCVCIPAPPNKKKNLVFIAH